MKFQLLILGLPLGTPLTVPQPRCVIARSQPLMLPRRDPPTTRRRWLRRGVAAAVLFGGNPAHAAAEVDPTVWPRLMGWAILFVIASTVHAAEIAITTLWPWKVRELAEEEGKGSPFSKIVDNLTRHMTAMLVASTCCNVIGTTLATTALFTLCQGHEPKVFAAATFGLAAATIFFGELLPKTVGVYCAERIARFSIPAISALAYILTPIGNAFSALAAFLLKPAGLAFSDDAATNSVVSEAELRLLVAAAGQSGSLSARESTMVESVLDLQDTKVSEVMTPRVEVVALSDDNTVDDALNLLTQTKYSRLPVYNGDVDNITGVVLAKSLIKQYSDSSPENATEESRRLADLALESTYFIPASVSVWSALEAMRRRRCHLAVVVDEYGGTAGIVTLEDILEEIVGEIYDEEDAKEGDDVDDLALIQVVPDPENSLQKNFIIRGEAELDDVRKAIFREKKVDEAPLLELDDGTDDSETTIEEAVPEEKALQPLDGEAYDCVTLSGLLCAVNGEIPKVGDLILHSGVAFNVTEADERRVKEVLAWLHTQNKTSGFHDDQEDDDDQGGDDTFSDDIRPI